VEARAAAVGAAAGASSVAAVVSSVAAVVATTAAAQAGARVPIYATRSSSSAECEFVPEKTEEIGSD